MDVMPLIDAIDQMGVVLAESQAAQIEMAQRAVEVSVTLAVQSVSGPGVGDNLDVSA